MNEGNDSKFERVLNRWDIIVLALGAMIGWGWVVSSGSWIESGGVAGAAGSAPDAGVTNYVYKESLGCLHRKNKKRVYKRRNF